MVRFKEATKICLSKILEQGVVRNAIEKIVITPPYTPPPIPKEALEAVAADSAGVTIMGLLIGITDGYRGDNFSARNILKGYIVTMIARYVLRAVECVIYSASPLALMVNPLIFFPFYFQAQKFIFIPDYNIYLSPVLPIKDIVLSR